MDLIGNLERMLAQGRDDALLRFGLGNEYLKQKQYTKAAAHLEKAIEYDPDYSVAWKLMGKALVALGDTKAAAEAFVQGITAAEKKGDAQAVKEMRVFLKRVEKG